MRLDPAFDRQVRRVAGRDAEALVAAGAAVLDVRTPEEFTGLGHIPGARLLPVDLAASAPAVLDDPEQPVLVCCEHAVRSRVTSRLLAQAGFTNVHELAGGMAEWQGARDHAPVAMSGPAPWLVENADLLPRGGRALDVACGRGRHALLLASAGFEVEAVDRDRDALDRLRAQAARLGLPVEITHADLEADVVRLLPAAYDVIIGTRYLHRPLFPRLAQALASGGLLIYETFIESQAERGRPTNPAFLLARGELSRLVQPLEILRTREGEFDGAMVASIVARAAVSSSACGGAPARP